jgi:hypothetical protein
VGASCAAGWCLVRVREIGADRLEARLLALLLVLLLGADRDLTQSWDLALIGLLPEEDGRGEETE